MKNRVFKVLFGAAAVFMVAAFLTACNGDPEPVPDPVVPAPGNPGNSVVVTKIELNRTELYIAENGRETLVATVTPRNSTVMVSWTSENKSVAVVDGSGLVRAVNKGKTVITASAGGKSVDCIVTVFESKGELTQSALRELYQNYGTATKIVIPEGYTSIAGNAFDGCYAMTELEIPATMKNIGGFYKDNLKTLTIKGGKIADSAFRSCPNLETVTIESAEIGISAFRDNQKLKTVTINSCEIGETAFRNCSKLETATIKNSKVGIDSFRECSSLTTLTLERVKSLDLNAFQDCSALEKVTFDEYLTSIGNYAFRNCTALRTVTFGNGECSIGNYAFRTCTSLKTVNLGGVTSIGDYVFRECSALESITIPASVSAIGQYIFQDTSIKSITADSGNKNYSSDDGILYNKDKTELVCYPLNKDGETFTIPRGVKTIGKAAFRGNLKLKSVVIGNEVESILNVAFKGCALLESVTIGKNVSFIGSEAFRIETLSSVTFNDPTGWWYALREDATSGTTIDVDYNGSNNTPTGNSTTSLSNSTTAATFLQGAFLLSTPSDINGSSSNESRYWFKKEKIDTPATSVIFNEKSYKIPLGESFTLPVTIEPANTSNKTITWSSSNPSVISVENGVLVAKSAGESTITATTANGKTATCSVTIPDNTGTCDAEWNFNEIEHWGDLFGGYDANGSGAYVPLSNNRLDPTSGNGADVFLTTGGIRLRGDGSNGAHLQSQSTSGVSVSSLDSIKNSKTVFTVRLYADKTTLMLKMRASSSTPTASDFAVLKDSSGATLTLSDGSAATIQLDGKVKTFTVEELPQGTYYIYTNSSRIYSITTTNKPVTRITLSKTSMQLPVGGTAKLTATLEPENARSKKVTLTSSNPGVVSVENGVLTVKSTGTATITASTKNGKTASCTVTVPNSNETYTAEWDFRNKNAWKSIFNVREEGIEGDLNQPFTNLSVSPSSGSGMEISLTSRGSYINYDHLINVRNNGATTENFTEAYAVLTLQVFGNDTTLAIETIRSSREQLATEFTVLADSENNILPQPNGKPAMITGYDEPNNGPLLITVEDLRPGTYYIYSNGSDIYSIKATNVPPTSMILDRDTMELPVGGTARLTASLKPENAAHKTPTLESNNPGVVSVENGVLTVHSIGTATITATTSNGLTATCDVTVPDPSTYKYEAEWDFRNRELWEGRGTFSYERWESFTNLNIEPTSGSGANLSVTSKELHTEREGHRLQIGGGDASLSDLSKASTKFSLGIAGNNTTVRINAFGWETSQGNHFTVLCDSENNILTQPDGRSAVITSYGYTDGVMTVEGLDAGMYYLYSNGTDMYSITATNITSYNYSYDDLLLSMLADKDIENNSDNTNLKEDQVDIKSHHFTGENAFLSLTGAEGSTVKHRTATNKCIEIKNEALKVTFKGTGSLAINATSNGGSNTSSLALKKSDGTYVRGSFTNENITQNSSLNHYIIKGTSGARKEINDKDSTTITFNITEPGDYIICTLPTVVADGEVEVENNTDRPTRIYKIRMID